MKKIIKILSIILCTIPIFVFLYFETRGQKIFAIINLNKLFLILIELLNIAMTIFIIKKKNTLNNKFIIAILFYFIAIAMIPCYETSKTYAPNEEKSYLMGLALKREYRDIFGIPLKWIH